MPSSLSEQLTKTFCSRSSKRSSTSDGNLSTCSETSALLNTEFPNPKFPARIEVINESDVLDPEDQAWGSPPPFKWSLSTFSRKKKSQT